MPGIVATVDEMAVDVFNSKNYIYSKDDTRPGLKATVRGTFAFAALDTLKKTDSNSKNRSQSDWRRAQYVIVADVQDDRGEALLKTWRTITRAETHECAKVDGECQCLLVHVSEDNYVLYDAYGNACMEGPLEDLIEDFEGPGNPTVVLAKLKGDGLQLISYGAPGTGKSKRVDRVAVQLPKEDVVRTTFHPDSDYSTFVGAYKPTMTKKQRVVYVNDGKTAQLVEGPEALKYETNICYEFVPQAFAKAYVQAWKRMAIPVEGKTLPVMLVIEEINRGDCAKVFGDLFQLLDRRVKDDEQHPGDATKRAGFSEYPVLADSDLADYIRRSLKDEKTAIENSGYGLVVADENLQLMLPPNMYIWATMNTSDQSLFPMDSAFKRRWDWKYVPIEDKGKDWTIKVGADAYKWWSFLKLINDEIADYTSSEDKQLGYFFAQPVNGGTVLDTETFVSKVIFYLWKDVFRDDLPQGEPFKYKFKKGEKEVEREIRFTDFYQADLRDKLVSHFLEKLGVEKVRAKNSGGTDGEVTVEEGEVQTKAACTEAAVVETGPAASDDI